MLEVGRNCWRIEKAQRVSLIVDAADYFRLVRQAMVQARSQIVLIGWDFDTRIDMVHEARDGCPTQLGAFISWLPKNRPGLQVYILKWDLGSIQLIERGTTILRLLHWMLKRDIHFKLDSAHPPGASHHQKIVVIDDQLAFCGGIDMTAARWDTREHKDHDQRRRRPTTRRLYGPWHDATMATDGAAARALGELARERWRIAGGEAIEAPSSTGDRWPGDLEPMFTNVDVAIARTVGEYQGKRPIREIEALFVDQIKRARRYIYAENQYFASRVIAKAIADRLGEPNCPEIVLINPQSGEDWLDEAAMGPARAQLVRIMRETDTAGRFRIYCPIGEGGEHIYVHSKILIVDDQLIHVGSANMNNRSMGLDSECDLTIDAAQSANGCEEEISAILHDLLSEHLGASSSEVAKQIERTGSIAAAIEALSGKGRRLKPFEPDERSKLETELADEEILDPEGASDDFEPMRPGLLTGIGHSVKRRIHSPKRSAYR
jgi:phospholipase D1/2